MSSFFIMPIFLWGLIHILICTKVKIITERDIVYAVQIIVKMPITIGYKKIRHDMWNNENILFIYLKYTDIQICSSACTISY